VRDLLYSIGYPNFPNSHLSSLASEFQGEGKDKIACTPTLLLYTTVNGFTGGCYYNLCPKTVCPSFQHNSKTKTDLTAGKYKETGNLIMAFQTESQRVLEGFNLRRASTVAHFALAIGARFHELDGPSGSHTIPLTILISLNIVQQTTVRELVHRARQDRVLGRIVGEFISGSLSERLGVCVINGNDELLHAARVLEYQIDHLQRYYDMEHVAGKDSFQGGDTEVEVSLEQS